MKSFTIYTPNPGPPASGWTPWMTKGTSVWQRNSEAVSFRSRGKVYSTYDESELGTTELPKTLLPKRYAINADLFPSNAPITNDQRLPNNLRGYLAEVPPSVSNGAPVQSNSTLKTERQ
jgi:hypothetical protein